MKDMIEIDELAFCFCPKEEGEKFSTTLVEEEIEPDGMSHAGKSPTPGKIEPQEFRQGLPDKLDRFPSQFCRRNGSIERKELARILLRGILQRLVGVQELFFKTPVVVDPETEQDIRRGNGVARYHVPTVMPRTEANQIIQGNRLQFSHVIHGLLP
jgi:hypothetical protein